VVRTFSAEELAEDAALSLDRIEWLLSIGILKPREPGAFRFGDVFRAKLIAALLEAGFTSQQVEWAVSEGHVNLDRVDEYLVVEPGPRSQRTFAEFMATAGPRASLLPAVYASLGLPQPDPSSPIHTDEEERLQQFLKGWGPARSDDTLVRAARLLAEGTRMATLGWVELFVEQVAGPVRERLYSGEIERSPEEARETIVTVLSLLPRMMEWLFQQYLEQRSMAGIVEGFEEFFAARGLAPPPQPSALPAVVFVDLTGYTRLTEEHGDEVAVRFASTLQREAEAVATENDGRLVKLLGDGAMLRFPDAERGLMAALTLVKALNVHGKLPSRAGVHAGPLIERDLDLFGRTVNLASRLAQAAGPSEVLVSEAVRDSVHSPKVTFEQADVTVLKGITERAPLFRAVVDWGR
jgi:adenylate cyclase